MAIVDGLHQFAVLPDWLRQARQPELIRAALEQHVPELAAGELRIRHCDPSHLRLKRERWDVMYELALDGPGQTEREVVVAGSLSPPGAARPDQGMGGGAFGTAGWHAYLPELGLNLRTYHSDQELAALPVLTDPERARELLEQSIRACSAGYRDIQIQACTPKIMRYNPGSRCTVLYHVEYPPGLAHAHAWPEIVVAKTYSGDKGRNAYDGMCKLWQSPFARDNVVTVAEPLAYVPEHRVLIQGPIREEQTLKDLLRSALRVGAPEAMDELLSLVRMAAAGLAALHGSGVRHGETATWEDEIAEVREVIARLAVPIPALGEAAEPLLERLEAIAAGHPAGEVVPTHRSFRPAQVLIHQRKIGFIDFDGFCQAEPALDVALFRATVVNIGLNTSPAEGEKKFEYPSDEARLARLARLEMICDVFLSYYEELAPVSRQRVALWEALDTLTNMLHCWTKVKPTELNNAMSALEHHLRRMGLW